MDLHGYQVLVWVLSSVLITGFVAFALTTAYLRRRRLRGTMRFNMEEFITARSQIGALRLGWSFFAGALGAWVISGPPSYTASGFNYGAGAIGLVMYSLASGLPVIMVALAGNVIRRKVPHVLSLTDFMGWRFGWAAKTYVVLLCLFNMSIACLAEYTTIGTLFGTYLGTKSWVINIIVGATTMIYTAYGGLYISILTDQVQGIAVTLLFAFCVIYVAADFRYPLPTPFPGDCCGSAGCTENPMGFCLAGTNKPGYSSIFVMPASLFTATVFSEAMWQRAWASSDRKALLKGSILGCTGIVLVVFFVGLCGILAAWGGQITATTDYNLYFFAALGAINENNNIDKWIGVIVILLAVGMNMSAVDSLQNGLTAGISSHLLKGRPVSWTKLAVLIINVPLIVLGARPGGLDLKVLDLFLLANMICCTSAIPVLSGLAECLHRFIGGASMIFSCVFPIFCTSWYGVDYFYRNWDTIRVAAAYGYDCTTVPVVTPDMSAEDAAAAQSYIDTCSGAKYQTDSFGSAMNYTWMGNGYAWDFFLVPLGVSIGSLILCGVLNAALQRWWKQPAVLGFTAPATHPHLYPSEPQDKVSEGSTDGEEAKGRSSQEEFDGKPSGSFITKSEGPAPTAAEPVQA
ncbi:hypothetical protein COHA_002556 [Chlorella ohadii]|uniref:Uncharacterized protein n=1 Tax=Chlorella ohadii TaxID=2649997 RepID=A0AAD5DWE0_9CHLO|nr:hypothetical protein COHA_002556 [Chlorella ohadii]